jgi:DNA-binding SARP family transcriptional activator/Flp pilus assembly protein TadD
MPRAKKSAGDGVQLRMLGRLAVCQDGSDIELPASRKVRALLAYLALATRATPRTRLCELLWESASDARGELRWHLTKLRVVVGAKRVDSDDGVVRLALADCIVDAFEIQTAARTGIEKLPPARARALLRLFGGDFLEGLEIERCPGFTSWLLAQRRRFRAWRVELLQRLADTVPEAEAFAHLEIWLELEPFDVRAHERLLRLLARGGRFREGKEHLEAAIALFRAEGLDSARLGKIWCTATGERAAYPRTTDRECEQAYDCFLQGRQHLARMMQHGLESSRRMFVRAIELDPHYGPAWAGLTFVHSCLAEWFEPGKANFAYAEQASRRALEISPHLAESHVARGLARSLSKHYDDAMSEFETAIRINPYLFEAHYYFARTAFARGDMARAAELFGAAAQLRQDDFQSPILLGTALRALGRDDAAQDAVLIGIRRAEQVLALNPNDGRALSLGAGALVDGDQTGRALDWSRRALALHAEDTSALVNVACVHARLDQRSEALDLLEGVFARGCGRLDWVKNDPDYANLRNEPRFHRLLGALT